MTMRPSSNGQMLAINEGYHFTQQRKNLKTYFHHLAPYRKGALNVVMGNAPEIGDALLQSTQVRKITFTGSTAVGKKLMAGSANTVKKEGTRARTGTGSSHVGSASDDNATNGNDANTDGDNCNADINGGNNDDTNNINRDGCN